MDQAVIDTSQFLHVRVLVGIVLGLGITHLLKGAAGIVQHPSREKIYWIHLGWVLSVFLSLIHFWWWEFELRNVPSWTFELYFFVTCYAMLYYLLCALLFPGRMSDYSGFKDYFLSRRRWFFGILALTYAADFLDTWIKGEQYLARFGVEYPIRNGVYILLCLVAASWRDMRFQGAFLAANLLYQISWIYRLYNNLA
jgi:hypothetical protein